MKLNQLIAITFSLSTLLVAPAHAESMTTKCSSWNASHHQPSHDTSLVSEAQGAFTPIPLESVRMLDTHTAKTVMVQSLQARRTGTDTVEVVARVFNCSAEPQNVVARTHFMDATQFESEPASAWTRVMLPAHALSVYSERSIGTASVGTFVIEMQIDH